MKLYEVLENKGRFCFCYIKFVGKEEYHFMTGYNAHELYYDYDVKSISNQGHLRIYEIEKAVNV